MIGWIKFAVVAAAVAACAAIPAWINHNATEKAELRLQVAEQTETLKLAARHKHINNQVVTKWMKSTQALQQKAQDVQVAIAATPDAALVTVPDAMLSGTWRLLHDTASGDESELPGATGGADAAAVTPKEASRTIASNYQACLNNADQLEALQGWVRWVRAGSPQPPGGVSQ